MNDAPDGDYTKTN